MILKIKHEVLQRMCQTILVHLISFNYQHPLVSFTAKTMAAPPQNRTGLLIHHTLRCQTDNHETSNKCQPFQDSLFHCKAIAAVIQRWNMSDNRLKYVLRCRPCGKGNHHSSISEPKQYMQTTANQTLSQGNHLFSYCLYGCE